jgi:hypothetical protein
VKLVLEIYDLNLQEIIYSQKTLALNPTKRKISLGNYKSNKLIDNISFTKARIN